MATFRWIILLYFAVSAYGWWRDYPADEAAVRMLIMGIVLGLAYLAIHAIARRLTHRTHT